MVYYDLMVSYKVSRDSSAESAIVTTVGVNLWHAQIKMREIIRKAEEMKDARILIGGEIKSIYSLWI